MPQNSLFWTKKSCKVYLSSKYILRISSNFLKKRSLNSRIKMYTKEYPNPCPMGALICVIFCIYKPMPSLGHDILAEKSEKVRRYPLMRSFCCFFLFQDDEGFLLLFVLFLSDSTFAEIYTLSSPTYHICSALHYFIQYFEGNSDF